MKDAKRISLIIVAIVVFGYCVYASYDWYWTVYSWIHPDISRQFETKFQNLSDEELQRIMNERASPRTNGAMWVWDSRHPVNDSPSE